MPAYTTLRERLEPDCGIHMDGALSWAESDEERVELREQYARLRGWGYPVEWVTPEQVTRDLAPELCLDRQTVREVLHLPTDGGIDAPLFIQTLLEEVRRCGSHVRCETRVREVTRAAGHATGVVTTSGDRLGAAAVVNCAGPAADRVAASAGVRLPLTRVPGLLVVTERLPLRLRHVVHALGLSFRPDGGGRVVILSDWQPGGSPDAVEPCPSLPPPPGTEAVVTQVARYLPALASARVEAARRGVRPMPSDGLPILGPHPELPGFYIAVTHSGVTLGPVLGPLVAAEVTTGQPEAILAPYRPQRFLC
jgi:glycine/D-amino acid oxidase-like deaminating enzyme